MATIYCRIRKRQQRQHCNLRVVCVCVFCLAVFRILVVNRHFTHATTPIVIVVNVNKMGAVFEFGALDYKISAVACVIRAALQLTLFAASDAVSPVTVTIVKCYCFDCE